MEKNAVLSEDRKYRYSLTRKWGEGESVVFVGLNPSTADESADDPTIRRCIAYAKDWGYSGLVMVNLFAFRATDPKELKKTEDPIGASNDSYLLNITKNRLVIAAWGNGGSLMDRGKQVADMIPNLSILGSTKDGHPRHPLYLPKSLKPIEWKKV